MTVLITAGKHQGKTNRLIRISAERGGYIICHSRNEASRVFRKAKDMELDIPFPLTYTEFINGDYYGKGIKEFYLDNLEIFAAHFVKNVPIYAITMNFSEFQMEE